MDKRYQVFVSSTFADLQDERQEVMQALLELDCIPAGMELFPAANEDQWTLIKRVIDDCDYYLVIVAGRYGSLGPDGVSYTEMEYRYAMEKNKPIIGFIHKNPEALPAGRTERSEDGQKKLDAFRELVRKKMCRVWESPADLGSQVSRSLVKLIKTTPAVGWVRGDLVPDDSATAELLTLRKKIEELQAALQAARQEAPEGTEGLAQGDDLFHLHLWFDAHPQDDPYFISPTKYGLSMPVSWNDIFSVVSPLMINELIEEEFRGALNSFAEELATPETRKDKVFQTMRLRNFRLVDDDFQTIKIQLRALGLIDKSTKPRSVKDTSTYWKLTPYGDMVMTKLRAIQRS